MAHLDQTRQIARPGLTAAFVRQIRAPGRYGDGGGLYLVVDPSGASRWVLRVQSNRRRRDVGLGSARTVSLADARDAAHEIRRKVRQGHDPVAARRAEREGVPTFEECARKVHASNLRAWRSGKHTDQWLVTLQAYVFPVFGSWPVNRVGSGDVLRVLAPIWTEKPETARRVLQRVRNVLDHATAAGLRSGENPARLVASGLPKQNRAVRHHLALPYGELPSFIQDLHRSNGRLTTKLALEFLILTAARSGEVRGATREEFDLEAKTWTVPGERMKSGNKHVVPLSRRAAEIVRQAQAGSAPSAYVFSSSHSQKPLSDMALTMIFRRMGVAATPHGCRSSFKDWCSEETNFSSEVSEMALAHVVGNKVEAAYRRGQLLRKRRELMDEWANFVLRAADA